MASPVQERHHDQSVVGNHVAVAPVLVVAVLLFDLLERASPIVRVLSVPLPNIADHSVD